MCTVPAIVDLAAPPTHESVISEPQCHHLGFALLVWCSQSSFVTVLVAIPEQLFDASD